MYTHIDKIFWGLSIFLGVILVAPFIIKIYQSNDYKDEAKDRADEVGWKTVFPVDPTQCPNCGKYNCTECGERSN